MTQLDGLRPMVFTEVRQQPTEVRHQPTAHPLDTVKQPRNTVRQPQLMVRHQQDMVLSQPMDRLATVNLPTVNLPTARAPLLHCTTTSLQLLLRRRRLQDMVNGLLMVNLLLVIHTQRHLPTDRPATVNPLTEAPMEVPMETPMETPMAALPTEVVPTRTPMVAPHMVAHTAMHTVVYMATHMVALTVAPMVMHTVMHTVMLMALLDMALLDTVLLPLMVISTTSTDTQQLVPMIKLTTQEMDTLITLTKPLQGMEASQPTAHPLDMVKQLRHTVRQQQDMVLNQPMDSLAMVNLHTVNPLMVNLPTVRAQQLHCTTTSPQPLQAMDSQPPMVKNRATQQLPQAHMALPAKRAIQLLQALTELLLRRATLQLQTLTDLPAKRATHPLQAHTEPVVTLTPHLVNTLEPQLPPTTLAMVATVSNQVATVSSQAAMARIPAMEAQQPMDLDHMDPSSPLEPSLAKQRALTVTLMYSTWDLALTTCSTQAMRPESTKRQA